MYGLNNFFTSILCLIGAFYFGFTYVTHKTMVDNAAHWPRVSGIVDVATLETSYSRRSTTYRPHISYHFNQGKTRLRGDVIAYPNPTYSNSTAANTFMSFYREGSICSVYYNPQNPSQCCLRPGESSGLNSELWLCMGAFAMAAIVPFLPDRRYGYGYGGSMYNNPLSMITPSRN